MLSGIVGVYSKDNHNVSQTIYYGLYALQHRGQISSGIAVNHNGFVDYHKDLGLVNEGFNKEIIDGLVGNIGIGHVRYAQQSEGKNTNNAQPLVAGYKMGPLGLSNDGSLVNVNKLKDKLIYSIFQTDLDGEVVANLIAYYHEDNIESAIVKAIADLDGSYSMVLMTWDKLIGARDPHGLKPLSIGKYGEDYILASETCAFDTIGAKYIRDVEPGEVVRIDENGITTLRHEPKEIRKCLFEFIYFARPDSGMNNRSLYSIRRAAGRKLFKEFETEGDVVIGAPDSGTVAAMGYAAESGIPYKEGIIKNRYVGRTFIEPSQELREQGVMIKLNALRENVEGKRIVLVDDSIVRGTTIKRTVSMLKNAGAKEIHVRISCPPVTRTCYLGMDTPSEESLIGANMTVEEIREEIGADSLYYLSLDGLIEATGGDKGYCTGCFDGNYAVEKEIGE
ncbi:MAG: amidophosphoribosyltransferase [Tissierellia bacterium]|nr:amidophosphoribosyltransferase [Tissierellia bacterium]